MQKPAESGHVDFRQYHLDVIQSGGNTYLMPQVFRLGSLIFKVYFLDHAPPHFHVAEGPAEVSIALKDLAVLAGSIPSLRRALGWAAENRQFLIEQWNEKNPNNKYVP